jgi:SAM-dependent methyltransferase
MIFDEDFWTNKYQQGTTGWDAGGITTPLKTYIDQLNDKNIKILIPGCGYGHEVKYLYDAGFRNVFVVDLSATPLEHLQVACPKLSEDHFIQDNFFNITGAYDLIIEQTFFSAIHPDSRMAYIKKMSSLLTPGGKLVGLLFSVPLNSDHPPFGGSKEAYVKLFSEEFELLVFEASYNSIAPRAGAELFFMVTPK